MTRPFLELRRDSAAKRLREVVDTIEETMAREDFDPDSQEFTALREDRDRAQSDLADAVATIDARRLADRPPREGGEMYSDMRIVLREYDRGNSPRFDIPYDIQRAYHVVDSSELHFKPNPTRVQVDTIGIYTPTLDSIRTVQSGQNYEFTVPPPPVAATTVAEKAAKPGVEFTSTKVSGSLELDAALIDVTRQALEDDASAENMLRNWLIEGVKLKQEAKAAAAIVGATGTLTATGSTLLISIRNGKAALSAIGIQATTVYVNPTDSATIDVDAINRGNMASPEVQNTLWGMTKIENPGITAGTAVVGSLPQAVWMLYRSGISTYITDSGMTVETTPVDRFSRNILGILGEGRSKVHVVQPKLLVKCTVGAELRNETAKK